MEFQKKPINHNPPSVQSTALRSMVEGTTISTALTRQNQAVLFLPVELGCLVTRYLTTREILKAMSVCVTLQRWLTFGLQHECVSFEAHCETRMIKHWLKRMEQVNSLRFSNMFGPTILSNCRLVGERLVDLNMIDALVSDKCLLDLFRSCENIRHLSLGISKSSVIAEITDAGITEASHHLSNLESISIYACPQVTSRSLCALTTRCLRLWKIVAVKCSIQNPIIHSTEEDGVFLENKVLRYVDVSACREIGDDFFLPSTVETLKFHGSARMTDAAIENLLRLDCLKELCISNCLGLTDAGLVHFARGGGYSNLVSFDCSKCIHFTDNGLAPLLKCAFPTLQCLNLHNCFRVSDALFHSFADKFSALREVDMKGLNQITDRGVESLARASPNLVKLNVASCTNLSDESLKAIGRFCAFLEDLDLFCVHKITERGLWALAFGCRKLAKLNISWCYRLTSDVVQEVLRECPMLKTVVMLGLDNVANQDGGAKASGNKKPLQQAKSRSRRRSSVDAFTVGSPPIATSLDDVQVALQAVESSLSPPKSGAASFSPSVRIFGNNQKDLEKLNAFGSL